MAERAITDRLIDAAEAMQVGDEVIDERRARTRHLFSGRVAMVTVTPKGERSKPLVLQAQDNSIGGMRVISRQMIHPGAYGALQLIRSDGKAAIVGVRICYCRYVSNMQHHTGLQFVPLPEELITEDFLDAEGRMLLLDPQLDENRKKGTGD